MDLDLQRVIPPGGGQPGSPNDDGRVLPYGRQLCAAFEAVIRTVRSPTEYESSPLITGGASGAARWRRRDSGCRL